LTLKETKIRLTASDLEEGRHYPTFPRRKAYAPVEYRYTFFRRIIHRVKPALRLFGKRRTPFFAFLHLMLVTKVYAWIFYWAWRIRAFCSYFICFLLFLPFVTTAVWLFVDEQVVVWEALGDIHRLTAKLLHEYTDLKHVTRDFSDIVAALIIIPATVYATAVQHPYFVVGSALIFAWDAMTSHGGELSDAEFHESRCNY